jgi:hypothetical protein
MKKILFLLIGFMTIFSCKDAEPEVYDGQSMLNFNKGVAGNGYVLSSATYSDYKISYGSIKPVEGNHQVQIKFDASKSTAVLGTDFQIINATDELSAGEVGGEFTIRIFKASATQAGKTATFTLGSSTLTNAVFDQTFTLNMSLTCPVTSFVGNFNNSESFWNNPGTTVEIVENPAVPNQLLIKDYLDVGKDLVLNYNPTTFAVTFADQNTGYFSSANNGYIWLRPSTVTPSTFNPCTRVMTLNVFYYIPNVGSYGDKVEKFLGL